jgi:hypothetical protein
MEQRPLHFLLVTADRFPPFRPEASILFGKELPRRGHRIDWVLQAENAASPVGLVDWRGCRAWVARTVAGTSRLSRMHKHLLGLANDARAVGLVLTQAYDFVQVKDKFLAALLLLPVAKLRKRPFVFWLFPYPGLSYGRASVRSTRSSISFAAGCSKSSCTDSSVDSPTVFVQSDEMKRSMGQRAWRRADDTRADGRRYGRLPDPDAVACRKQQRRRRLLGRARRLDSSSCVCSRGSSAAGSAAARR